MNKKKYNAIVDHFIREVRKSIIEKNKEYSNENDVYATINKIANVMDMSTEKAILSHALKQIVLLTKLCQALEDNKNDAASRKRLLNYNWEERILDTISYTCLLGGRLMEIQEAQGESNEKGG